MTKEIWAYLIAIIVALMAIGVAIWMALWVKKLKSENAKIAYVATLIKRGANTFLKREYQILAAFANCLEIVNLGGQGGGIQNGGYISWYNPAIGDKTALSRQDYLDSLEPTFFEHVGKKATRTARRQRLPLA